MRTGDPLSTCAGNAGRIEARRRRTGPSYPTERPHKAAASGGGWGGKGPDQGERGRAKREPEVENPERWRCRRMGVLVRKFHEGPGDAEVLERLEATPRLLLALIVRDFLALRTAPPCSGSRIPGQRLGRGLHRRHKTARQLQDRSVSQHALGTQTMLAVPKSHRSQYRSRAADHDPARKLSRSAGWPRSRGGPRCS